MSKIIILLFLIIFSSCKKVGYYYTSTENYNEERVNVTTNEFIDISISAVELNNKLTVSVYMIQIDEGTKKSININDFSIKVDNYKESKDVKEIYFTKSNIYLRFKQFKDIQNAINDKIEDNNLVFYISFDKKEKDVEILDINVNIKSKDLTFKKEIKLKKHKRYKLVS